MGNRGIISSSDVQWMTAGSGIIHQEMPKGDPDGSMYGFQLWTNLPKTHKMADPRYRDVKNDQIPGVPLENGTKIKVICGSVGGRQGSVRDIITDPDTLDITIPQDQSTLMLPNVDIPFWLILLREWVLLQREGAVFL